MHKTKHCTNAETNDTLKFRDDFRVSVWVRDVTLSLFPLPGGSLQEIRSQISHPSDTSDERGERRGWGRGQLRGPVGLRRRRHAEAVLQRFTRAPAHEQTVRDLPPDLPV